MKKIHSFYCLLLVVFMGFACTPTPMPVKTVETVKTNEITTPPVDEDIDESPYYHYTRSEIYKEKGQYSKALDELLKAVEADPASSFLKKELIALYLHKKETDKALEIAQNLVELEPENADSLIIFAKLKQMLNQTSEAREIYQKILQLDPAQENVYLFLGRIYMDSDNLDEAFRLYTKMAEQFPDAYAAHFFLGKIHAIKNNPEYAEKELLKTLELNPALLEPRFELITIYQNQDTTISIKKTIKLYQEILDQDPNNIRASLELPLLYHNHGEKEKAALLLSELGKKNMENNGIAMVASRELLGKKRYKEASIIFTGMLKGAPEDSTLHYLAGISYDALKQTRKAINHFLKVKPDSEHYKKTIVHIAFSYSENEQKDKAIKFLENKHQELPEDVDITMYLASFYEDAEEYETAISLLNKGITLYQDNVNLIFRLGVVQDKAGKKQACMESMKRVIELDPDNANALNYLGYTYADMGENLDLAEELVLKALTLKPDDGFITDSLGWIYYKKGIFSKAVSILEKAVGLTDSDPVITEHLGDAYKKDNQPEKALATYKKAKSKSTQDNPDLDAKIKALEKQLPEKTIK